MLGTTDAMATVAVKDVDVAKRFYEGTLGLEQVGAEDSEALTYKAGNTMVLVYKSQYAGTNEATAVTWAVGDDLEGIVQGSQGQWSFIRAVRLDRHHSKG